MSNTNVVFDTFESIKYSKNEIEQAELRYSKGSSVNPSDDYMGTHSLTHSLTYLLTHSLTHLLTHSPRACDEW